MDDQARHPLVHAVLRILKPLARMLLRNGMACAEFTELARRAYVETAFDDFAIGGRKPSVSRAAVVTGLSRKEVRRLMTPDTGADDGAERDYNRAARVVTGWVRDPAFLDDDGSPARLPLDEGAGGFAALVHKYGADVPARAVLDELTRVGVVEVADRHARLLKRAYVPVGDDAQALHIVGANVSDLLETLDHNLARQDGEPRFQRTVSYDNIPPEALAEWRRIAAERSQQLLEELDRVLARHDRDASSATGTGERIRTGVGIFYFESSGDDADKDSRQHSQHRRDPR